jgi:hypothetical protein
MNKCVTLTTLDLGETSFSSAFYNVDFASFSSPLTHVYVMFRGEIGRFPKVLIILSFLMAPSSILGVLHFTSSGQEYFI